VVDCTLVCLENFRRICLLKKGIEMARELSKKLARDYFQRALGREEVVVLLISKNMHADAVRESQELVELALKGMLRLVGIDPPKIHDVGAMLQQYQSLFP
jgi:HEPN domain-containing protein